MARRVSELVRHWRVPCLRQDDSLAVGNKACAIAVLSALALPATLYLLAIGPYWKISPDSVSYVSAAVSLASGQGYIKDGEPVLVFPPGTSLAFAIPVLLFPGSYLALNALVTVFALLTHGVAFVLFKRLGRAHSAAIPLLLLLGSTLVVTESTRLLSDVFYLFLSMAALAVAEYSSRREGLRVEHLLLAALVLFASLTRVAGVALIAPVALHSLVPGRK